MKNSGWRMETQVLKTFNLLMVFCAALLLSACAGKLPHVERTPSYAFSQPLETTLGQIAASEVENHAEDESGFTLIRKGRMAFASRISLVTLAEKSLDVQYYIWEPDTTGNLLAQSLIEAADRGVRVRLLLDDNNLQGRDHAVLTLNAHPNIQVRVFNPFVNRKRHAWDFASDFGRVNHRMHNKVLISDSALAVVGGRNIGDHYFGVNTHANFRDLDIAAVGPIVNDLAKSFDYFWNGDWAYPIQGLVKEQPTDEDMRQVKLAVNKQLADDPYPYPLNEDISQLTGNLKDIFAEMAWAKAWVIADDPAAIGSDDVGIIKQASLKKLENLQHEMLIESAYFVQQDSGVEKLAALVERGVRVRVLTNSLASNDVAAAHAGYEKTRKDMLKAGIELYELRADSTQMEVRWEVVGGHSKAALHTKALEFDDNAVFVGSYNLDPRSANINTEIGIYIESEQLASDLKEYFSEGVAPANAWHVTLNEKGKLQWNAEDNGEPVYFDHEPDTTWWQRFVADFIKILPVQSQL